MRKKTTEQGGVREELPATDNCYVCDRVDETFKDLDQLCNECRLLVLETINRPRIPKKKLKKSTKKKLWKLKGRSCEDCGLTPVAGGPNIAIHPFRPANWDGRVSDLKVFCPSCLGSAARKRDKILECVKIIAENNE